MRDAAYPYREIEESGYVYPIIDLGVSFYEPAALRRPHVRPHPAGRARTGAGSGSTTSSPMPRRAPTCCRGYHPPLRPERQGDSGGRRSQDRALMENLSQPVERIADPRGHAGAGLSARSSCRRPWRSCPPWRRCRSWRGPSRRPGAPIACRQERALFHHLLAIDPGGCGDVRCCTNMSGTPTVAVFPG
ncbi:MAG: hypothetical protein MZV70_67630 [Desulfobacterales bacterium]|nr:hypothetical protein [Desulfobacterales bacterium]